MTTLAATITRMSGSRICPGQEQRQVPRHPEGAEQQRAGEGAKPALESGQGIASEAGFLPGATEARDENHEKQRDRYLAP